MLLIQQEKMMSELYTLFNEVRDLKDEVKELKDVIQTLVSDKASKKELSKLTEKVEGISSQAGHSARHVKHHEAIIDNLLDPTPSGYEDIKIRTRCMPKSTIELRGCTITTGQTLGTYDISQGVYVCGDSEAK